MIFEHLFFIIYLARLLIPKLIRYGGYKRTGKVSNIQVIESNIARQHSLSEERVLPEISVLLRYPLIKSEKKQISENLLPFILRVI